MSNSQDISFETTHLIRDACLCLHVQRAARTLSRQFDEALRPVGLTSGQFSLLNALNRSVPPSIAPVAQLLAMDRTTLTAALKPLERNGLVAVAKDPDDRRNRLLRLTDKGRKVLTSAVPIWRSLHAAVEAGMSEVAPDDLRGALKGLSQSKPGTSI
ncbi:MarR family winged helix-turn-helix transcriptional regulator [Microvirga sp. CF3016]|uniref:MarR family winged helix-turn-helix transcriptional regulator n=1 Tax=Microvirga sp. CF3016 TaxID=3110181 RepID=UPI002E76066C|nr:MarR family winged helix-turn-helix transcriptional regulator [Microvirga sp. CF3016]MEE1609997.1 MarR family winged helix-turn-helix transcriptional regulator [Microvirga sp. CF3016]